MDEATTSFLHLGLVVEDGLQQLGSALSVDAHVAADLVHRLADTDSRGKVVDDIDILEHIAKQIGIAHIALDQLHLRRERYSGGPSG